MCVRKLCGPEGRLMELPARAPKPFQGGLCWKAPVLQQHIITAARDTYTPALFLLTFFKRNKTLVEPGICSNMDQSRAHGENQNTCLTSTVLTSPKLFINMDTPRKNNWAQQGVTHCACTLGHPSCQSRKKINLQIKRNHCPSSTFILTNKITINSVLLQKLHTQDKRVLEAISCY